MTTLAIFSTKGGVAKSTTAVALASALANFEPALLVDLEPNGQIGLHYGLPPRSGVYHWLMRELPLADCLYHGRPDKLMILPGDSYSKIAQREHEAELPQRLRELSVDYAFTIFDTGGACGLLQEAAIAVADQVIIPFRAETPGVDGLYASLEVVRLLNPHAQLTLLPVCYDMRLRVQRDTLAVLQQEVSPDLGVHEMYAIRQRVAVVEAVAEGKTIWEYAGQGVQDVRVGYAYLAGRVLRLAGRDGTAFEELEAVAHGETK